ncbi:MAG: esterase family protein [Anaerolineae bacterium]|nr:esterase family protein [Anaerolineae bacterium]
MNVEYHHWYSSNLGQEMELKVYGHAGKPVLVFPAQAGRFFDFENFGMVGEVEWFINEGLISLYAVDSVDAQSWANFDAHPHDRAIRHESYDAYICQEVMPFIQSRHPQLKAVTTGCSMGGYHSANFFFRHPDLFDGVISLSGLFSLRFFIGEYMDEAVYFNSPLDYLPNLQADWYIHQYRESNIIICVGQGAWEDEMRMEADMLRHTLDRLQVPAWVDYWGQDVNHDWPWWRRQFPYFISHLLPVFKEQIGQG